MLSAAGPLLPLIHKMAGHAVNFLGVGGLIAAISLHDGAIVAMAIAVVIVALVTARSKVGTIWREDAEGQRAAKEHALEQLGLERKERAEFDKQQQELRHDLKNEIATLKMQLQATEAKTDLTSALDTIQRMNKTAVRTVTDAIADALKQRDGEIHAVLVEIRDKLPDTPPSA